MLIDKEFYTYKKREYIAETMNLNFYIITYTVISLLSEQSVHLLKKLFIVLNPSSIWMYGH